MSWWTVISSAEGENSKDGEGAKMTKRLFQTWSEVEAFNCREKNLHETIVHVAKFRKKSTRDPLELERDEHWKAINVGTSKWTRRANYDDN